MQCLHCGHEAEETQKFCRNCGVRLRLTCPDCGSTIQQSDKFCAECGLELKVKEAQKRPQSLTSSERKYVTALFADVSGYTALAERMDPEEVKDLMNHLFKHVTEIIIKYEGFIEKFAGDAVLALFGVPQAHEDDAIRAIRSAMEIHRVVRELSQEVQERIKQPLAVHIGINSGLVVTGEIDFDRGTQDVAGDTINVTARLCSLAKPGETLVGHATFSQGEAFFHFEHLEPVQVKGRAKPVQIYKVLSPRKLPLRTKGLAEMHSELIGRQAHMEKLSQAAQQLIEGQGSIISVCGEAGTGKSRLLEEFKSALPGRAVQWHEGHAYAYTQNTPYQVFIDLLNRAFDIDESDLPDAARRKMEGSVDSIVGGRQDVLAFVGGLLSLPYPGTEIKCPDAWKRGMYQAVLEFFTALVRKAPTLVTLEDLHWADPSSLELLRFLLLNLRPLPLFLCIYRPPLVLLTGRQIKDLGGLYQEVQLADLSAEETRLMLNSLLGTGGVSAALHPLIHEKAGGNPFYVEQVVNSLIETGTLYRTDGDWTFKGLVHELSVPTTIQGVIMARLDRLDPETRLLVEEAAVIGRTFYQEILEEISSLPTAIEPHLYKAKDLGLITIRSIHPDVEYSFKHVLIQESAYNRLLKKQRQKIHERIGLALERFCRERALEPWESLAFHFKRGHSLRKAIDYLRKSGAKSLKKYALDESVKYYQEAYDMLARKMNRSAEEDLLLIDLLMEWCLVFYYTGGFKNLTELLLNHVDVAESLDDKAKTGAFYAWLGFSTFWEGTSLQDSYRYLHKALSLAEKTRDQRVIAYACAFLMKTCAEMGLLEEGMHLEQRVRAMLPDFPEDGFLHMNYFSGKGYLGWFVGNKEQLLAAARELLDYGKETYSLRCQMIGNMLMAVKHFVDLDLDVAIGCAKKVLGQGDPYHAQYAKFLMGMFQVHRRDFEAAVELLTDVIENSERLGTEYLKTIANLFLGVAQAALGQISEGIRRVENSRQQFAQFHRHIFHCMAEYILGNIYLSILDGPGGKSLTFLFRNLGSIVKHVPFARRKAEKHLNQAINLARVKGAKGFLGQPCLQLGLLCQLKGRKDQAREHFLEALHVFEECRMDAYKERARNLLASLA